MHTSSCVQRCGTALSLDFMIYTYTQRSAKRHASTYIKQGARTSCCFCRGTPLISVKARLLPRLEGVVGLALASSSGSLSVGHFVSRSVRLISAIMTHVLSLLLLWELLLRLRTPSLLCVPLMLAPLALLWPSVKSILPKSEMDARSSASMGNESTSSVINLEIDSRLTLMLILVRFFWIASGLGASRCAWGRLRSSASSRKAQAVLALSAHSAGGKVGGATRATGAAGQRLGLGDAQNRSQRNRTDSLPKPRRQ